MNYNSIIILHKIILMFICNVNKQIKIDQGNTLCQKRYEFKCIEWVSLYGMDNSLKYAALRY
jgi:hypothetical protein